jgi:hypothetical protein
MVVEMEVDAVNSLIQILIVIQMLVAKFEMEKINQAIDLAIQMVQKMDIIHPHLQQHHHQNLKNFLLLLHLLVNNFF